MKSMRLAFAMVLLFGAALAQAADTYWQHDPATPGDWSDPANWTAGVPSNGDTVYVDNGGTAIIDSGSHDVAINVGFDNAGTVRQTGGNISPGWHIFVAVNAGSTGNYVLSEQGTIANSHSNVYVGWAGEGRFTQTGGVLGPINMFSLAREEGGRGTCTLQGGQMEARLVKLGQHGTGEFVHTGGGFTVTDRFYMAPAPEASATYSLSGTGVLSVVTGFVGSEGTARFTQTGGTHTVSGALTLGRDAGSSGTYTAFAGRLSAGDLLVGSAGSAAFEVGGPQSQISLQTYVQSNGGELVSGVAAGGVSVIDVGRTASLDGAWRVVDDGAGLGRFDILTAGEGITGSFDLIDLPGSDWSWGIEAGRTLWVEHVPEPATLALLGMGAIGLLRRRRARKRGLGGFPHAQGSRSSSRAHGSGSLW